MSVQGFMSEWQQGEQTALSLISSLVLYHWFETPDTQVMTGNAVSKRSLVPDTHCFSDDFSECKCATVVLKGKQPFKLQFFQNICEKSFKFRTNNEAEKQCMCMLLNEDKYTCVSFSLHAIIFILMFISSLFILAFIWGLYNCDSITLLQPI